MSALSVSIYQYVTKNTKLNLCFHTISGILVPVKIESSGLGGSLDITLHCNGCTEREVKFQGSSYVDGSKRTVVGLSLAVAFIIAENGYSKF